MNVVAFVQARTGSSRLPGKTTLPIWCKMPLLEVVLRRVRAATSLTGIVLVTSTRRSDDELVGIAERVGTAVFRGSEGDVLGRFAAAMEAYPVDAIVRICADNPFVEPAAIDELVAFFAANQPCDYASNHTALSGLPDGMGAEVISNAALRRAAASSESPRDREHVTTFIRDREHAFSVAYMPATGPDFSHVKLDIDVQADYDAIRRLTERLPETGAPNWDRHTVLAAWAECQRTVVEGTASNLAT